MADRYSNLPISLTRWLSGAALAVMTLSITAGEALAQTIDPASRTSPPTQTEGLNDLRPLNQATTTLSIPGGKQLMAEAETAIANQNYSLAVTHLVTARDIFNQLSNYYQTLAGLFVGVDSRINQSHRQNALETAQLRDQASYQLALLYRSQDQPDAAVPLLMEILQSQQPTRDLGQRAYQQLFELGFVNQPFGGSNRASSASPARSAQ